ALALVARGSAKQQATSAIAERLGAQALVQPALDRALLLAREGVNLDDSLATRSNLLAALLQSPAALRGRHGGGPRVPDEAVTPNGRTLAERSDNGTVAFFDTRTLRELGPRFFYRHSAIGNFGAIVRPVRALAFSGDGRTLAVGDSGGIAATLTLLDAATHRRLWSKTARHNQVTADVVFSPDGRTVVAGEVVSGRYSPPPEQLVVRRASDGKELRHSRPIAGGRLIGFALGGRFLLVTSGEKTSYLLNARTLAPAPTFHIPG